MQNTPLMDMQLLAQPHEFPWLMWVGPQNWYPIRFYSTSIRRLRRLVEGGGMSKETMVDGFDGSLCSEAEVLIV